MATAISHLVRRLGRLLPSSPILDKEMRVSSRRRSSYLLRAGYLACLTLFVALTWMDTTRDLYNESSSYVAAHMSEAGRTIVVVILWFQFIAAQVIALFMLGTAIPAEMVRGTMITLACTPLTAFQIVLGKLLSKLLQVILLVAMSLPLLAVVRVFGGVPWGMVVGGLAVTLSSVFLVGAWSLLLSVRSRSLLRILVLTAVMYFACFGLGAYLSAGTLGPVVCMYYISEGLGSVALFEDEATLVVIANCLAMVGVALLMLRAAARRLRGEIAIPTGTSKRSRASRASAGGPSLGYPRLPWPGAGPAAAPGARPPGRPLAVKGPALIWKDLRTFLPSTRGGAVAAGGLALVILMCSYIPLLGPRHEDYVAVHWLFIFLYLAVGCFLTVLASSTAITVEKESRALPILLTAPISDTRIIVSKATGVFYRALACWALLLLHLFVFSAAQQIDLAGAAALVLVAGYLCVFLTGLGLYVSSMLRSSSNAMLWTLGICALLWGVPPTLAEGLPWEFQRAVEGLVHALNPFTQIYVICRGALGAARGYYDMPTGDYAWRGESIGLADGAVLLAVSVTAYAGAGLLLARRARTMMRRRLFV